MRGLRIDLYVRYSGEHAPLPGVHEIMGADIRLLFKRSRVIRYTVHGSIITVPAGSPMRTILAVPIGGSVSRDLSDAEIMEKVRSLATVLKEHPGTLGTLFMRSVGAVPGCILQSPFRRAPEGRVRVYEMLTLHRDEQTRISARRVFFSAYRDLFQLDEGGAPEAAVDDEFPIEPVSFGYFTDDERAAVSGCTGTFGLLVGSLP